MVWICIISYCVVASIYWAIYLHKQLSGRLTNSRWYQYALVALACGWVNTPIHIILGLMKIGDMYNAKVFYHAFNKICVEKEEK